MTKEMHTLILNGHAFEVNDPDTVRKESQNLTPEQQAQARQNIQAASVGQIKEINQLLTTTTHLVNYIFPYEIKYNFDSETETATLLDFDWQDIVDAVREGRPIAMIDSSLKQDEFPIGNVYYLGVVDIEEGYIELFSYDSEYHTIATVKLNGTIEFEHIDTALDTTLSIAGRGADAKAVGEKLGDIETALDSIIAIQESLIGGATE